MTTAPEATTEAAAPRATYRVQLHPGFGFDDAAQLASYLARLGVSHIYTSPYLQAAPGSTHGYDVVDHRHVNAELGGAVAHHRFCRTLGDHGLGQILDVVPNHMAIGAENPWWWDVLENGRASRYARYFDVDWDSPDPRSRETVLLPILGDHYGRVLEAGELQLVREGGSFLLMYHEHRMPVAPPSLDRIVGRAADATGSDELAFIAASLGRLPVATASDRASVRIRHRDKEVLRTRLAVLADERSEVARALDEATAAVNADVDQLDALIDRQHYRLAYWRTAGHELDYRRFFDVTTLIGLRIEDRDVFEESHALPIEWLREGILDGLRIDHPDGLRDPDRYLEWLREEVPGAWVVVEKILEHGEPLPGRWPVAGTTGYDFATRVGGLFVDPAGEAPLTQLWETVSGRPEDFETTVRAAKHEVMRNVLAAEVARLTALFLDVCHRHRRHRDHTRHDLAEAVREVVAAFPVYRTYVRAEAGFVAPEDVAVIDEAIARARAARPDIDDDLLVFLRELLTLELRGEPETEFVMRFQQLTGPVMAKGVEDTAFYRYLRLVSLNEVGGDPGVFGTSVTELHDASRAAHRDWPTTMLSTSTHDTKRSEDVRARISVLSEMPEDWRQAVERWSACAARHRDGFDDRATEYLLFQTLVGAWPIGVERLTAYMEKAAREAKLRTSWTDPDAAYEEGLRRFLGGMLSDPSFIADLEGFLAPVVAAGRVSSLAQTLLKLTAPGVPDIYQGTELWDLSLVDPDNRRPVDYAARRQLLDEAERSTAQQALERMDEGLPKLWLIRRALAVRREHAAAFGRDGDYVPLSASGERVEHVVAYTRGGEVAVVVPRLVHRLGGAWGDTTLSLPDGTWRDELGGSAAFSGSVPVADLLGRFPVALLTREGAP